MKTAQNQKFKCSVCESSFNRKATLKLHYRLVHAEGVSYVCEICRGTFYSKASFKEHQKAHEMEERSTSTFISLASSHRQACEHFRMLFPSETNSVHKAFLAMNSSLVKFIKVRLQTKKFFKLGIVLMVKMRKNLQEEEEEQEEIEGRNILTLPVRAHTALFTKSSDIQGEIAKAMMHIQSSVD